MVTYESHKNKEENHMNTMHGPNLSRIFRLPPQQQRLSGYPGIYMSNGGGANINVAIWIQI